MKAYKEFFKDDKNVEEKEVLDVEQGTLSIISKVLGAHAGRMTLDELIQFSWLFVDSAFTEIKYILRDSCVVFKELIVDDITRCTQDEDGVDGTKSQVDEEIIPSDVDEMFADGLKSDDFVDDHGNIFLSEDDNVSTLSLDVEDKSKKIRQISGVAIAIEEKQKPSRQVCVGFIEMAPSYMIMDSESS